MFEHNASQVNKLIYHPAIDQVLLHDHSLSDCRVGKHHKSEPPSAAGGPILHYHRLHHLTEALEVLSEAVLGGVPRNPSDEELAKIRLHSLQSNRPKKKNQTNKQTNKHAQIQPSISQFNPKT